MEHKDKVPQEDQDLIKSDIAALKEALANENTAADALKEKVEAVKRSSMKIGEAMYKQADAGGQQETPKAEYDDEPKKDTKKD